MNIKKWVSNIEIPTFCVAFAARNFKPLSE